VVHINMLSGNAMVNYSIKVIPSNYDKHHNLYESMMRSNSLIRIVIIGAGYAGMFLAINLSQSLKELHTSYKMADKHLADIEIVLVDRNPYHQLLQEIHLVAAGYRTPEQISIPINSLIEGTKIMFIQSSVKEILADERKLILDESILDYTLLVICLGSNTKYFDIEGAKTNTIPLRSIDDAKLVYDMIQSLLISKRSMIPDRIKKSNDNIKEKLNNNSRSNNINNNIVIVGGGATGVSLGGALADYLNDQAKLKASSSSSVPFEFNIDVTIVEALPNILAGWNPELAGVARKILESKGVRFLTNSIVSKVNYNKLILKDGSGIDTSLIIWTAGVKGYEIKVLPEIDKTRDGRIIVNGFCQIEKFPNVFAIGDIAAVQDNHGKIYPPIAQIAVREAKYLADVIAKQSGELYNENKKYKNIIPLKDQHIFNYDIKIQVLSLGIDDYVCSFGNQVIKGNLAEMIDEFGKLTYVRSLKSKGEDISSKLYDDSLISKMIAGFSFAGFAFARWFR
jgi:NADH dehydrogenase